QRGRPDVAGGDTPRRLRPGCGHPATPRRARPPPFVDPREATTRARAGAPRTARRPPRPRRGAGLAGASPRPGGAAPPAGVAGAKLRGLGHGRDGRRVAVAPYDQSVGRVWDPAGGQPVGEPLDHGAGAGARKPTVYGAAFSPDGGTLLTLGDDGVGRQWDV